MKKLIIKDKKRRVTFQKYNKQLFILKSIFQNSNLFTLIRWNAFLQVKALGKTNSEVLLSPRCLYTTNRKRFNNLTPFSRHVLIKLIRLGKFSGIRKSSW